jgi:hypothetical protein
MKRPTILALITMALLCLGASGNARADELKFRTVMYATFVQFQDIPDRQGHRASLARFVGLALLPDQVGTIYFIGQSDYVNGKGSFSVYNNPTLSDGSVLWFKSEGKTTMKGTTSTFDGKVMVLPGGTGRFAGAKGEGTVTGARPDRLIEGANLYNDVAINISK